MVSKDTYFSPKQTLNFNGTLFELSSPVVMGILNITPDSFFDGGRYLDEKQIMERCKNMLSDGATIIDIGAYSSRPGATDISTEEEQERLAQALQPIRKSFPDAIISVDTFRADVARFVVQEFNVNMINDISAGELDPDMLETVASCNVPYILMHMKGTPQTMQQNTNYDNLINDIIRYLAQRINLAVQAGIKDIIVDPGFGFGKTIEQNFKLLANLGDFNIFQRPILVGLSRKSTVYKTLGTTPENALNGTLALETIALLNGANILRVHDVKETMEVLKLLDAYKQVK
ncbi:MAG TPA: dihydropteroate synthase [Bacteroidales bacterium]|nr:dihydropteroate synthase [Bacteroidales bacterium]